MGGCRYQGPPNAEEGRRKRYVGVTTTTPIPESGMPALINPDDLAPYGELFYRPFKGPKNITSIAWVVLADNPPRMLSLNTYGGSLGKRSRGLADLELDKFTKADPTCMPRGGKYNVLPGTIEHHRNQLLAKGYRLHTVPVPETEPEEAHDETDSNLRRYPKLPTQAHVLDAITNSPNSPEANAALLDLLQGMPRLDERVIKQIRRVELTRRSSIYEGLSRLLMKHDPA